jgi:hypothetical protein
MLAINNCTKRASRNNPQKQLPKIINIEYEWLNVEKQSHMSQGIASGINNGAKKL